MGHFARHKLVVSVGAGEGATALTFWFIAPQNTYSQPTALTASQTGVTRIPDNSDTIDSYAPTTSVESLLKSGLAVRKIIGYRVNGRRRTKKIIIAKDLADTFVAPANYGGDPRPTVVNPLDATFS
jgi:hypothetical protein